MSIRAVPGLGALHVPMMERGPGLGHVVVFGGSSRAVLDHRVMNWVRNVGAEQVTTVQHVDVLKQMHQRGGDYLQALEALLEQTGEIDLAWTNMFSLEAAAFLAWAREEKGAWTVVDNDDLLTDVPEWNPASQVRGRFLHEGREAVLEQAHVKTNSTPFLQRQNGGLVCPNFADPENWVAPNGVLDKRGRIDIACPISASRVAEWEELAAPAFVQLAEEFPDTVRWWFLGGWPVEADMFPAGQVVRVGWAPVWLYKRIMGWIRPDIILSPLTDIPFNEAKSNIKFLEAGICGGTLVGSPVGELKRTVTDGVDGLLTQDFEESLRMLIGDRALLRGLQEGTRNTVLNRWTWPAVKDSWLEAMPCR